MNLLNKRVSVIGIGSTKFSGFYAALLAKKEGAKVFLSEKRGEERFKDLIEDLRKEGVEYEFGKNSERILNSDLIVVSPGVPLNIPVLKEAREKGIEIIGELEFGFRFINGEVIAITGTSGKSTTTTLTYLFLKNSGLPVTIGGNIGIPLSKIVMDKRDGIFVLEVSCFQLETIKRFKPHVVIFVSFHEDHLNRYSTMEEYLEVKKRTFINQTDKDYAILNYDDKTVRNLSNNINSRVLFFSTKKEVEGAYLTNGKLLIQFDNIKKEIIDSKDILLRGEFNIRNILGASLGAYIMGAKVEAIRKTLKDFKGLEHRLQYAGRIKGITFINDSKSTKPESTIAALSAFPKGRIILLLGGSSKKTDFHKLINFSVDRVKYILLMGETAPEFEKILKEIGFKSYKKVKNLREAVEVALNIGEKGDFFLLSPACASFDMFVDFEDRGEKFIKIVEEMSEKKS